MNTTIQLWRAAAVALSASVAGGAAAQTTETAAIDVELAGSIDFRSLEFSVCFDTTVCAVGALTIVAERQTNDGSSWVPERIYWDPIDGLGVKNGGQNDEIDFDERLRVTFQTPTTVQKIWISDLFATEHEHYGASGLETDLAETAAVQLLRGEATIQLASVNGASELPPKPFNAVVWPAVAEEGDLFRRVVIRGPTISVEVPQVGDRGVAYLFTMPIGTIDPEKRSIFEGVETVEIDIATILPNFNNAPINLAGSQNARELEELLSSPTRLETLRASATIQRIPGASSNGEVALTLTGPAAVDGLQFISPFGTSNDFSVAGIVVAN